MTVEFKQSGNLLSVDVIYHVCQYLRQDITVSMLRRWQVAAFLDRKNYSNTDQCFLQIFEGRYAELSDFGDEGLFRSQMHELIGHLPTNQESTGSTGQLAMVQAG